MKSNKSPGTDELTSDVIKEGGPETIKQLVILYNNIFKEKKIPTSWKEAKIILLHKKGDKTDIKHYRQISLLSHMYKILTRIIQNRIKTTLDANQPREQAGFRQGYSTMDKLFTINQLIEKSNEYQLDLCIGFIDYEKAFDSVEHKDIFASLRKAGIEEGYIQIIQDIYNSATSRIHIDSDRSNTVYIKRGVRQGDTISPKLFTAALEEVFQNTALDEHGINIDGEMLTNLRFADDVALCSSSVRTLNIQLNNLNIQSKKIGLNMHKGKTKYMTNTNINEEDVIEIEDQTIEMVNKYKYLGQTVQMKDNTQEEVETRIRAGWGAFGRYRDILCDKNISISLRRRVFNQCVIPAITYGSECWTTTKTIEQKLKVTQRSMERQMLNISLRDHISCEKIRAKTGVDDILSTIISAKWRWAGHIARRNDNRWAKRIYEWQPRTGKRRRGRQNTRWRDSLVTAEGITWPRKANDRLMWRNMKRTTFDTG